MKTENIKTKEDCDREEIVSDLVSNIFVEAGAGAGKTSILVKRILNQLSSGAARAQELVAITFTNKASQELKSRIGDAVRRALHEADEGGEEYKNLKAALYDIDRMQISTIHSFCYRLLMEQTFLSSMRMDMQMIVEEDAEAEKEAFFWKWYKKQSYKDIRRIKDNFSGKGMAGVLKDTFSKVCDLPMDTELFYDKKLLERDLKSFQDEAAAQKARLSRIIIDEIKNRTGRDFETLEIAAQEGAFLAGFKKLVQGGDSEIRFLAKAMDEARFFKTGKLLQGVSTDDSVDMTLACKERFSEGFDAEGYKRNLTAYQNALVIDFIIPARKEYKKQHQNRYITNDVLLEKARELVTSHAEARAFFRKKFKCIYVDEFQDTDHVQTDLIWALCSNEDGGLRPGSLFIVGDPKQSIYRFRGADLPLYYEVKDKMSRMSGCKVFHLNYNFRSGGEVISFVNENSARFLPDYRPMESKSREPKDGRPERQLCGVYISWDPTVPISDQLQKNEVWEVVSIIKGMVDGGVLIWDKDKRCHRPIEYRDFLVLCHRTYGMEKYLSAMLDEGIPVQISGKVQMSKVRELARFVNIYRYLAYPKYARAREGALQTVLGFNIDKYNEKYASARLRTIREAAVGMDAISMALYLARHPEYYLDHDRGIEKNYLVRIQSQVQQMIETVGADEIDNAQALSDRFMQYISGEVDRELSLAARSGAVRFMNLHKAKGLEGRIVIICNRNEDLTPKDGSFQVKKDGRGYLFYYTVTRKTNGYDSEKFPAYVHDDGIREKARAEEMAEYRRLEYVEATRSMEALIFIMPSESQKGKKKEYAFKSYDLSKCKRIDLEFPEIYETDDEEEDIPFEELFGPKQIDGEPYDLTRWQAEFTDEHFREGYVTLTPSSLELKTAAKASDENIDAVTDGIEDSETATACENNSENNDGNEAEIEAEIEAETESEVIDGNETAEAPDGDATQTRPTGNIFGTVMHRALELLVKQIRKKATENAGLDDIQQTGSDVTAIDTCVLQAVMEDADEMEDAYGTAYEKTVTQYREFLRKVLSEFAACDRLTDEIRDAAAVYTEFPFSFFTTEEQDEEMFAALRNKLSGVAASEKDALEVVAAEGAPATGLSKLLPHKPDQSMWINGKADLVMVKTDGSVHIVDYKSDINPDLSEAEFAALIEKRYGGQMELYRYVCAKLFNVPVEQVKGDFYTINRA